MRIANTNLPAVVRAESNAKAAQASTPEPTPELAKKSLVENLKQGLKTFHAGKNADLPGPMPDQLEKRSDPVAFTPIPLPNTLEGGREPNPVAYTPIQIPNTLEGGGSKPNPVAYTPITIPNTPEGGNEPGPNPVGFSPIPLPDTLNPVGVDPIPLPDSPQRGERKRPGGLTHE